MLDISTLSRAALDGKWEMFCPSMRFVSCPGHTEIVWKGSGIIRAGDGGRLSFKCAGAPLVPPPPAFIPSRPEGEVYEAEDHVVLIAEDHRGREWRSNPILVHTTSPFEMMDGLLSRPIKQLLRTEPRAQPRSDYSITIVLSHHLNIPMTLRTESARTTPNATTMTGWSLDHHVQDFGHASVEFRSTDKPAIIITAKSEQPIDLDWAMALCHTIEFMCACRSNPILISVFAGATACHWLFSGPFSQPHTLLPPPCFGNARTHSDAFWSLAKACFEHVQRTSRDSNRLLDELSEIRLGASTTIRPAALSLAVGIEAIADLLLKNEIAPKVNSVIRNDLATYLDGWNGDDKIKSRIVGMINRLNDVRTVDRLYAWAKRTGTPDHLVEQWKRLRDPRAHGSDFEDVQTLYDRYFHSVELMYRLIASAIGYSGPVVSSSQRGWGVEPFRVLVGRNRPSMNAPHPPAQ